MDEHFFLNDADELISLELRNRFVYYPSSTHLVMSMNHEKMLIIHAIT